MSQSYRSMTTGAQQAMRRTMEVYSNTTRFALACNTSNKIIEPIQSRCAILRYAKLKDAEVLKRLLEICEMEKVRTRPLGWLYLRSNRILNYRYNIMTRASRHLSSLLKEICDKPSIIYNRHGLVSVSLAEQTCSKFAINPTQS